MRKHEPIERLFVEDYLPRVNQAIADGRAPCNDVRDFDAVVRLKEFILRSSRRSYNRYPPRNLVRRLEAMLERWESADADSGVEER